MQDVVTELQLWVQDASPDGNDTAGKPNPPAAPAMETVKKTRRKLLKLPLKLGGPGFLYPGMTDAQRKVRLLFGKAADLLKRDEFVYLITRCLYLRHQ